MQSLKVRKAPLGQYPSDWNVLNLEEATFKIMKGIFDVNPVNYVERGIPFLRISDMRNNSIDIRTTKFISNDLHKKFPSSELHPGDIIISKVGSVGLSDKIAKIPDSTPICNISQNIVGIKTNSQLLDPNFLLYLLQLPTYMTKIISGSNTTTLKSIQLEVLRKLLVPVPRMKEQQKISSSILKVDELNKKTDQIIEQTQRLKKGLMQKLLTKGTEVQLSDIIELTMGQSPPGNSYSTNYALTPLLNGPTEFGLEYPVPVQFTTKSTKLCRKDDILLCVRGSTTGRLNLADRIYCIGRGLASIRGKDSRSNTRWLYYQFQRIQNKIFNIASGGGSTFPNINSDVIRKMMVPCPNLNEQLHTSNILSNVDKYINSQIMYKIELESLKRSLIQNLLSGKIRVKV